MLNFILNKMTSGDFSEFGFKLDDKEKELEKNKQEISQILKKTRYQDEESQRARNESAKNIETFEIRTSTRGRSPFKKY